MSYDAEHVKEDDSLSSAVSINDHNWTVLVLWWNEICWGGLRKNGVRESQAQCSCALSVSYISDENPFSLLTVLKGSGVGFDLGLLFFKFSSFLYLQQLASYLVHNAKDLVNLNKLFTQ